MTSTANLSYVEHAGAHPEQQCLDLYMPSPSVPHPPLLVYVHSGFWLDRDKAEFENVGLAFAEEGIAVAVINYRLSQREDHSAVVHPMHTHVS